MSLNKAHNVFTELNDTLLVMVRPRTRTAATCSNQKCVFFQKETGKDILNRGKNKAGHHRYFCNHCKTWSVETANTPFYHRHLSKDEIITVCTLLAAQHGIRRIEQITRHHRDTIGRLLDDLALNAPYVHNLLLD